MATGDTLRPLPLQILTWRAPTEQRTASNPNRTNKLCLAQIVHRLQNIAYRFCADKYLFFLWVHTDISPLLAAGRWCIIAVELLVRLLLIFQFLILHVLADVVFTYFMLLMMFIYAGTFPSRT